MGRYDMQDVQLRSLSLEDLVVLDALLELRSVARAGGRVGLSASATSHALARLRRTFDDELLVRAGRALVPTERASALAPRLRAALAGLAVAVGSEVGFDPARSNRTFTLAMADYGGLVLVPSLVAYLSREAPACDVVVRVPPESPAEALARGEVDLVVAPRTRADDVAGLKARTLFDDGFACVLRRGHPALRSRLTAARFAALDHALIAPHSRPGGIVDDVLAKRGLRRRVACILPHFLVAPHVVAATDLVLTLPSRMAHALADEQRLVVVPPPVPVPGFTLSMVWHARVDRDPAHAYLRDAVVRAAAEVRGTAPVPAGRPDAPRRTRLRT